MRRFKGIFIEGSVKTPQVEFNHVTGELVLKGRSIPENAANVYESLLDWVNKYVKSPSRITNLRLDLEYYNTATSVWIARIVRALSTIKAKDAELIIHLYFDVDDFETMELEELSDIVTSLVGKEIEPRVSIGLKTYGKDKNGKIVSESTILI